MKNPTTDEFQNILSQIRTLTITEVASQLEALGLKKSGSPDGRFLHLRDAAMRVRARIDPPNTIVPYDHLHLYNEAGESLNASFRSSRAPVTRSTHQNWIMTVTSEWNHVHFHDAVVRSIEYSAEVVVFQLEDFFVDSKQPDRPKIEHLCLPKGSLIFKKPHSVLVRVYDSDTDKWQTLSPPLPHMDAIAEVTIAGENIWKIAGFMTDGRWLEWQIKLGEAVSLKTYETNPD